MATRIVGHNQRGAYSTWNDVDNEEPNARLYFEDAIMFTPHVLVYPLYGDITAYYYKSHDNVGVSDAYPVLYADENGQPGGKLTEAEPLMRTAWRRTGDTEGWVQATVRMRRTVAVGEKVWFAFFGFIIAPRYDTVSVQTLWSSGWQSDVPTDSAPTERVERASLYKWRPPMRLAMYFSYSDIPLSVDYVRQISDIASGSGGVDLTLGYRRFAIPCIVGGSDNTKRVQEFVRKCTALCSVVDSLVRRCNFLRKIASCVTGFTGLSNIRELLQRVASCASTVAELRCVHGIGAFVRSLVTVCDSVTHWRCIRRAVFTVCGLWERFFNRKGVHRVEVVLYSPITLELKLGGD